MKKLLYFEDIDTNSPEDYYETKIEFQGHEVSIDLNLDDEPSETWMEDYILFIPNLEKYHQNIKSMIKGYYNQEGLVKEFFAYHMEETADEIAELMEETDTSLSQDDRMVSLLKLRRIGFYFAEDNFATWDFTFGEFSDQIYVVVTDKDGKIIDTTWES
jgi:hypothetical protein